MDDTFILILLVIVMLVGSYLAGSIPLVVNLSEVKSQKISHFSTILKSLKPFSHSGQT